MKFPQNPLPIPNSTIIGNDDVYNPHTHIKLLHDKFK